MKSERPFRGLRLVPREVVAGRWPPKVEVRKAVQGIATFFKPDYCVSAVTAVEVRKAVQGIATADRSRNRDDGDNR